MAQSDFTFVVNKKDQQKLEAILDGLEKVDRDAAIQAALKSGMELIVNQGKSNLAVRNKKKTGNLSRSFTIKVNKKRAYTLGGFKRSAPKKGIKGANHSYLVDRGTGLRWTRRNAFRGSGTGSMFWTDAVESQGPNAQKKLMDTIGQEIDKIINKNK